MPKQFSDEWWAEITQNKAEAAGCFEPRVLVYSEFALRAVVIRALSDRSHKVAKDKEEPPHDAP